MTVISNLQYTDARHVIIDMDVEGVGRFTYNPNDPAPLAQEIKKLLAAGSYTIAPEPLASAGSLKSQIDAFRDQRLAAGYADATTSKSYQCDVASQGKWTAIGASAGLAILMGISPAPTFDIITADNSTITLSASDAFALMNARVMPWVSATMLYARTLKNAVDDGNAPADITAGWP